MYEIDRTPIPTLFGYTTLGEFSRTREFALYAIHCVHAVLPALLLSGTSIWIAHRRSSKGFSVDAQVLLLMAFFLRYAKDLWSDVRAWTHLFESGWILFETVARLLRVITSVIMVFITILYTHHHRVSLVSVLRRTIPYLVGCLALAHAFKRMGLIMPVYRAPSMKYLSSLFLETIHLLPQSALLSTSTNSDHATADATILLSLSFLAVTVIGITEQYIAYTMYGPLDFWERAVWTHGVKVACLVISLGCLVSASYQKRAITAKMVSSSGAVAAQSEVNGSRGMTVFKASFNGSI